MKNSGYHLPESSGHWHGWLGTASYSGAGLNGGRTFTNILPLKNGETMIGHDKHNINRLMETQRPISKPYCWFTEQRLWGPRWPKRSRHQTAAGWFFSSSWFFFVTWTPSNRWKNSQSHNWPTGKLQESLHNWPVQEEYRAWFPVWQSLQTTQRTKHCHAVLQAGAKLTQRNGKGQMPDEGRLDWLQQRDIIKPAKIGVEWVAITNP